MGKRHKCVPVAAIYCKQLNNAVIDVHVMGSYSNIMEILLDASAIMAVIVKEPERDLVIQLTKEAVTVSPDMVSYEIANALTKMMKKKIIGKEQMINAFNYFKQIPIKNIEIDIKRALEIAWAYKLYAYDACYLEASKRFNLPLLTFDSTMIKTGSELGIKILGGKNAGV